MSPLGKTLLTMCDNDLVLDLKKVYVPNVHPRQVVMCALWLGLRIKGGS